jgi:hypothetical protein
VVHTATVERFTRRFNGLSVTFFLDEAVKTEQLLAEPAASGHACRTVAYLRLLGFSSRGTMRHAILVRGSFRRPKSDPYWDDGCVLSIGARAIQYARSKCADDSAKRPDMTVFIRHSAALARCAEGS